MMTYDYVCPLQTLIIIKEERERVKNYIFFVFIIIMHSNLYHCLSSWDDDAISIIVSLIMSHVWHLNRVKSLFNQWKISK